VKVLFADIETDGLTPSVIHFIVVKFQDSPPRILKSKEALEEFLEENPFDKWCFHNGLGFDFWILRRLWGIKINVMDVIDTQVVSKTTAYSKFFTHSLKELGEALGVHKGEYTGDWKECTPEMEKYGLQDVVVLEAVYNSQKKFLNDPSWKEALDVEHKMAVISYDMNKEGFHFNKKKAQELLEEITKEVDALEASFQEAFPPELKVVNTLKNRKKKDGTPYATALEAYEKYPLVKEEGDVLECYDYVSFNPASNVDRIDKLWEAGWKPWDKTTGHRKASK
jgi:RNase_H superfamily